MFPQTLEDVCEITCLYMFNSQNLNVRHHFTQAHITHHTDIHTHEQTQSSSSFTELTVNATRIDPTLESGSIDTLCFAVKRPLRCCVQGPRVEQSRCNGNSSVLNYSSHIFFLFILQRNTVSHRAARNDKNGDTFSSFLPLQKLVP